MGPEKDQAGGNPSLLVKELLAAESQQPNLVKLTWIRISLDKNIPGS